MALSLGLLGLSLRTLPLGTAYAVWTGVGTLGTALLGIALFGESADRGRLACIGLIVAGIVGLKLVTPGGPPRARCGGGGPHDGCACVPFRQRFTACRMSSSV